MPTVLIRHRTTYRYRNPVAFGEHRMMLRPLEGHDQRLLEAELDITPEPAAFRRQHDPFGNTIAVARFAGRSDTLTVESRVRLAHEPGPALEGCEEELSAAGERLFAYPGDDLPDLERFMAQDDAGEAAAAFARRFLRPVGSTSLATVLSDLTHAIRADFSYERRLEGRPQTPAETLERRKGSCRDFAVLMMAAARSLGLPARFVSGYVYSASPKTDREGGGHTHAWAGVYLPSCGWVDFDPTNGIVGGFDLVRVAAVRDPRQAAPLHGTWTGLASDYLGMEVEVQAQAEPAMSMEPGPLQRVAGR